jgi:hypothetical protein
MTIAGLSLPLQVPWERLCVSPDMIEPDVCGTDHLPKWRSSLAVWSYVPEVEYQIYPGRKIVYLKVTATITGYQPRERDLEGRFNGPPVSKINVDSILDTFLPCNGAILQVTVGPQTGDVPLVDYPYFMDFQPKKRELYEMATDTSERSSRSLEETKVGKASGTAHSQEILDVDQGGSSSSSVNASVAGYGFGAGDSGSAKGQWGSKNLSSDQLSLTRSSDESRDRRETQSHTTQLSQMYNLLDSYHVGTNRAVFSISPRPHVLDAPSSLVKGPRPIDGIQEFFLVVNQPEKQGHLCVSARLDTGHQTTVPILDYEYKPGPPVKAEAHPLIPSGQDQADGENQAAVMDDSDRVGTIYYACHKTTDHQAIPYFAPPGYIIVGWNDLPGGASNAYGSDSVDLAPDGKMLTVTCDATSRRCFFDRADVDWGYGYSSPDTIGTMQGSWVREVEPLLRSVTKTQHMGDTKVLLLTTRGVCCCTDRTQVRRTGVIGVGSMSLDPRETLPGRTDLAGKAKAAKGGSSVMAWHAPSDEFARSLDAVQVSAPGRDGPQMSAREANEIGELIRHGIRQLYTTAWAKPVPYAETDLFIHQVHQRMLAHPEGRAELTKPADHLLSNVAEKLDRNALVGMPTEHLVQNHGLDTQAARRLKLQALGFTFS